MAKLPMCKSVFKNGRFPDKKLFAEKWLQMLNKRHGI